MQGSLKSDNQQYNETHFKYMNNEIERLQSKIVSL